MKFWNRNNQLGHILCVILTKFWRFICSIVNDSCLNSMELHYSSKVMEFNLKEYVFPEIFSDP